LSPNGKPVPAGSPGVAWRCVADGNDKLAKRRRLTVAIVDDQPVRRSGVERLVQQDPMLCVAASVGHVNEMTGLNAAPDLVVLDLPLHADEAAVTIIARLAEASRPIVISTWDSAPSLLTAARAGARACVCRHADESSIAVALRVVAEGGFYVCGRLCGQFQSELVGHPREDINGLPPRELETLRWIARGFTQAQIATEMGLTQATVNTYAKRIRAKLNASNKVELTLMAIQLGYLRDDHIANPAA
jgi:DNA-binding NarL/FixJ family response regulator